MGRQAHLTRLAFGRSPFTEPLRDADGEFVLGSNAHAYDNVGYIQQFDDRGHPRNPDSRTAARQLRRAQNDVLATVGVVVRKDDAAKSEWDKMKASDRHRTVILENQSGRELKANDRVAGVILPWFVLSLRRRILTFTSYSSLPLSALMLWEYRSTRAHHPMTSGLPLFLLAALPQMYRYYIRNPDVEEIVNYVNAGDLLRPMSLDGRLLMHCIHGIVFALEFPLQAFSTLQTLRVLQPNSWIPLASFIPFTKASPVSLPPLPDVLSASTTIHYLHACLGTPLVISILRDYLQIHVGYRLYALLRQTLIRADRPDRISAAVSDEVDIIEETSIPGVGYPSSSVNSNLAIRRYGPKSFAGALRIAFPVLYRLLNFVSRGRLSQSRGRLPVEMNRQIQHHIRSVYRSRRQHGGATPTPGGIADIALRRDVVYTAFFTYNLDADEELVDAYAWTDAMFADMEEIQSIPTPDPLELFDFDEFLRTDPTLSLEPFSTTAPGTDQVATVDAPMPDANDLSWMEDAEELFESGVNIDPDLLDLEQLLPVDEIDLIVSETQNPSQSNAVEQGELQDSNSHFMDANPDGGQNIVTTLTPTGSPPSYLLTLYEGTLPGNDPMDGDDHAFHPPTPLPGISRAVTLTDPALPPLVQRRTRSRTTLDPETEIQSPTTSENRWESMYGDQPQPQPHSNQHRSQAVNARPVERKEHRMTLLSTFALDSFAWHASAVITNMILLPIESMYLRSLVHWFVRNDASVLINKNGLASNSQINVGTVGAAATSFLFASSPMLYSMKMVFGDRFRVLGLDEWFGGAGGNRMRYAGAVMLTLGLEAVLRGGIWYIGTQRALRRGPTFGWGKF